jgi:hypothetical protein
MRHEHGILTDVLEDTVHLTMQQRKNITSKYQELVNKIFEQPLARPDDWDAVTQRYEERLRLWKREMGEQRWRVVAAPGILNIHGDGTLRSFTLLGSAGTTGLFDVSLFRVEGGLRLFQSTISSGHCLTWTPSLHNEYTTIGEGLVVAAHYSGPDLEVIPVIYGAVDDHC